MLNDTDTLMDILEKDDIYKDHVENLTIDVEDKDTKDEMANEHLNNIVSEIQNEICHRLKGKKPHKFSNKAIEKYIAFNVKGQMTV